jgi:MFS family permease
VNNNPFRTLRRHRDFRRLWTAAAISDIGTWMQAVTVTVLVATTSKSAASTAIVYSALFLPQAVCAPLGGLLADHFDRRHVAICVQVVQAFLAGILAFMIAGGVTSPAALAMMVAFIGCANAVGQPAYQAMIPLLVPASDLYPAVSLSSVSWNAGRILGPALAAVTAHYWGASATITANAISFLVLAGVIATIRRPLVGGGAVELRKVGQELKFAAKLMWHTPTLRVTLLAVVLMQASMPTLFSLVPLYADRTGASAQVLYTAIGVGALSMALVVSALARHFGRARMLTYLVMGASVMMLVASRVHGAVPATIVCFLFGAHATPGFVLIGGVVQREAPEQYRGRITSLQVAVIGFVFGVMAPLSGFLSDAVWGLRMQLAVSGAILGGTVVAALLAKPGIAHLIDGSDPTPRRIELRQARAAA